MSHPRRPWIYHRQLLMDEPYGPDALLSLADEIERRGAAGMDADPGEVSDWLRAEVEE